MSHLPRPNTPPILNHADLIRDNRRVPYPVMDEHGFRIPGHPIVHAPNVVNVLQNQNLVTRINRNEENEQSRNAYYWHRDPDSNNRYVHYKDNWGDHWYGFYNDRQYFWLRRHCGQWWWHDPIFGRWIFWNNGYWWWQNPWNPVVVYIVINNNYYPYYYPYYYASPAVQIVPETAPDPAPASTFDQGYAATPQNEPAAAQPDSSASQGITPITPGYSQTYAQDAGNDAAWSAPAQDNSDAPVFPAADASQPSLQDTPASADSSQSANMTQAPTPDSPAQTPLPDSPTSADPSQYTGTDQATADRAYYSKDGMRLVEISGPEQRADLFDVSGAGEPIYIAKLATGVGNVQFFDQEIGSPINVILFLNGGSFLRFDGQGHPLD